MTDPAAFFSYVRMNDVHDDGKLSDFRKRLSTEVQVQTGVEFPIFQDRNDIAWGQNWKDRIESALDTVTLLIPVLTPSFFASPACRDEVDRFLDRERQLGRSDLILPVYYVGTPLLDDPAARASDPLAEALSARQFADWRELRFEPLTSPLTARALAALATRMRDTFWQPPGVTARGKPRNGSVASGQQTASAPPAPTTGKTEPPTHIVDPFHRGDFPTIGAAVQAAKPGDRIMVRPGLYQESLVVTKPLEIIGDGPLADIEVHARGANVLRFAANIGRVTNLTLRQLGGSSTWYCVDITQGRLELAGCDISSRSSACVAIRDGAAPWVHHNHIHGGASGGVFVYDGGFGRLEDNDITGNTLSGVEITSGGDPTLRTNRIRGNQAGVYVRNNGAGTIEENDITGNALSGVEITGGANPVLRGNRIHQNKQNGILVRDAGTGTIEDNDIVDNTMCGVAIKVGGRPTIRGNRINRNAHEAVWVLQGGGGTVEDNDLTGNKKGAWDVEADADADFTRARNAE